MMKTRRTGTLSPKKDTGGTMRRGVLALVVLLLACTLMAGAVSATEVKVSTWNQLSTNFSDSSVTMITLDQDVKAEGTLTLSNRELTLNLNGKRLYNDSFDPTSLTSSDRENYSILAIDGANSKLTITGSGKIEHTWTAIAVKHGKLDVQSGTINKIPYSGKVKAGYTIAIEGSSTDQADYSVVTIGKDAVVEGYYWAVGVGQNGGSKPYGIKLDVYGTLKGNQSTSQAGDDASGSGGLAVSGNVQGTQIVASQNCPQITIRSGAKLYGYQGKKSDDYDGPAVYAAGYAHWTIEDGATLDGDEALSIKAGNFTINGGTFKAKGNYVDPIKPQSSASEPTGAAVSITSNSGYAGNVEITINGGTFESLNQCAFFETITQNSVSAAKEIKLLGGSFKGNETLSAINIQNAATLGDKVTYGTLEVMNFATVKYLLENSSATVKLGQSIDCGEYTKTSRINLQKSGSKPTLDLNGKAFTAKPVPVTNTDFGSSFIKINDGVTLTVKDSASGGKITVNDASTSITDLEDKPYIFFVAKKGVLILTSGTFESPNGYVVGGNGDKTSSAGGSYEYPEITINGGTLTAGQTAIYMPAYGGKLTITGGTVTGVTGGIDIRTGTIAINGGTVSSTGNNVAEPTAITGHPLCDGSAIVLESSDKYETNITLNIYGDAIIKSTNGAALRNLVRATDVVSGKTASVSVDIGGNAKLEGKTAAIENAHYTGDTPATIVGKFNLFGGYYQAPSYDKLLVGKPTVTYQIGYAMSDTPVKDDYYAPIEVKIPEKPATPSADGKTVEPTSGSDVSHDSGSNVVNITSSSGATGAINVNLTLTYPEGTTINVDDTTKKITAGSAPEKVVAEYADVPLDATTGGSFQLSVEFSNVTNITKLPTISTVINPEAKEKLETESSMSLISMIVVDISQMKAAGETPKLTLTFIVPISSFTGKDLNSIEAYHYDGKDLIPWPTKPTRTTQGDNYVFTLIGVTEASPWMIGAKATSPGPAPQPVPPVYSSGSGNMENAFRVLFETSGGSFISPVTYLSYGDKISQPPAPTKDGYTFGGWYKDSACTQSWSFASGIDGDMTLYAKWAPSSGGSSQTVSQTGSATAQQTVKATPAATQAQSTSAATPAASGTVASGSTSPAMTQAPAPVLGALLGLLAAGVLLRRRD